MSDPGNISGVNVGPRFRGSGPILILAVLFVVASFLAWYFTWFGRELSDAEVSTYLADEKHPRHVQHALLQIEQRIERGDPNVKRWYPQLVALSENPEPEFRLTVAWLMGFDNKSAEFHQALLKLLYDGEPLVRRNAALALVRFNDPSGRRELRAVLEPYPVQASADGLLASSLRQRAQVSRGALIARIQLADNRISEIRAPLPGTVENVVAENGSKVKQGDLLLTLKSDEQSVWEALRGLALIGEEDDLPAVQQYAENSGALSTRIKEQATLTAKAIQSRVNEKNKNIKQQVGRAARLEERFHALLPSRQ
jgi:biotin carboxyl carrier protein